MNAADPSPAGVADSRPLLFLDCPVTTGDAARLAAVLECLEPCRFTGRGQAPNSAACNEPPATVRWPGSSWNRAATRFCWARRRGLRGTPPLLIDVTGDLLVTDRAIDTALKWGDPVVLAGGLVIDIALRHEGPAGVLANLTAHQFWFRAERMGSMEGMLQSLKSADPSHQASIWPLNGMSAKRAGVELDWQTDQTLHWKGLPFDRHGIEYQALLDRAYVELFDQNKSALAALLSTASAMLTHSMGETDARTTVLTAEQFCLRLEFERGPHPARREVEHSCSKVALQAVSTGVYGYPPNDAARVAVVAARAALCAHPSVQEARFWLFDDIAYEAFADQPC